jgi:hypothetical protein
MAGTLRSGCEPRIFQIFIRGKMTADYSVFGIGVVRKILLSVFFIKKKAP